MAESRTSLAPGAFVRGCLALAVASGSLATSSVAWAQLTHNQQTQSVFVYTEGDGVDLYPSNNGPAVGGTWSKSDVRRSEVGDLGPFSAAVSVSGSAPGGNSGRASATIDSVLAADAIVLSGSISVGSRIEGNLGHADASAQLISEVDFNVDRSVDMVLSTQSGGSALAQYGYAGDGSSMTLTGPDLSLTFSGPTWASSQALTLLAGHYVLSISVGGVTSGFGGPQVERAYRVSLSAVPETGTMALMALGLLGVATARTMARRRSQVRVTDSISTDSPGA